MAISAPLSPFAYIPHKTVTSGGFSAPGLSEPMVYLDHNATTPLFQGLEESLREVLHSWGNPSSIHWASRVPKAILRETRQNLARMLKCDSLELIFNSGGSEGNTTVIRSVFQQAMQNGNRKKFITSTVEHPSVMKTFEWIAAQGATVIYIPVLATGELDLNYFKSQLDATTALVSIMRANNEFGSIFPLKQIVEMAHQVGSLVHTDAVQALGKMPVDLKDLGVDYASFSAHKFYALKGCGFLYVKKGSPLQNLIYGGGQERHRRAGTENVMGIASLKTLVPFLSESLERNEEVQRLRDHFEKRVAEMITGVEFNARSSARLGNTSSLLIEGVDGETLLMSLDMKGFAVSTGAACSAGNPEPSPALLALGLTRAQAQSSLRVSLGWGNTQDEVDRFVKTLSETVTHLRSIGTSAHQTKSFEKMMEIQG